MTKVYVYEHTEYPSREDCIRGIVQDGGRDIDDLFTEWLYMEYGNSLWNEFADYCVNRWSNDFLEEYFGVQVVNEPSRNAGRKPAAKRRTTVTRKTAAKRRTAKGARR